MKPFRILLALASLLALGSAPRASAQCTPGPHTGTISADQTWCAADSPHAFSGDVTVAAGVTLTIEAGSVVNPRGFTIQGRLVAIGTEPSPITFTAGSWTGLSFAGGTGHLAYANVANASTGITATNVPAPGLVFDHSTLGPGRGNLSITDSVVSASSSVFETNDPNPVNAIHVSGASSTLSLSDCSFTGSGGFARRVFLAPGAMTGADFTLAPQTGLEAWHLGGGADYTIPAGRTVTVAAGATIHSALVVRGRLVTTGTAAQPATFTAHWQWHGLSFEGGTGRLEYAQILTNGMVATNVPAPGLVFDHSTIRPENGGFAMTDSTVTATASTFETNGAGVYPIRVSGAASTLSLSEDSFTGSGSWAKWVFLAPGAMTSADFTLTPQTGLEAYHLGGGPDYTIPAGRTVTVAAGATVHSALVVKGRLLATGTSALPAVFSAHWQWHGITFDGGTGRLEYARVLVPGYGGAAINGNAVPPPGLVLDHCSFEPGSGGISIADSPLSITSSTFTGITSGYPIAVTGASSTLTLTDNTFTANNQNMVFLETGAMTSADFTLVPQAGLEAYVLGASYTIPAGRTVTVAAGTTLRAAHDSTIITRGRLVTNGAQAAPVTFTASRWLGLLFDGGTGHLTHTRVLVAGFNTAAITATNVPLPGLVLDHASVGPGNGGINSTDSVLVVRDSVFETNASGRYAIAVSGPVSTLSLSNNTFGGTGSWARQIGLAVGAMTGSDFTLVPEPTLDAYVLARDYTVPLGRTMTVAAGATIIPSPSLIVQGRLATNGTAASPVTLTGSRWTLVFDGGTGELRGALLQNGGFNDPTVTVQNQGTLLLERSRVTGSNRIRTVAASLTLRNTAFLDGYGRALEITTASTLTAFHTTLARSADTAVVVQSGSTATLTNTVFAASPRGVNADATSTVTLTNTLWDAVPTPTSGSVTQHGLIVGSAAFEADGYHVGATSAALAQGVVTAVADDLDGEPRPRPAGLLPDLGADESDGGSLIPGRTATPIAVGETKSATAPSGGFADFVVTLAPGQAPNLKVRVEAAAGSGSFRLLVRNGQFPLSTLFDVEGPAFDATSKETLVTDPLPGAWYLGVLSSSGNVPFTISVAGADRGVTSISPSSGGNAGSVVAEIAGVGFEPGSRVALRTAGVTLRSFAPVSFAPTQLTVRFDLRDLPPLACDVAVVWPDGEEHVLPGAFRVLAGGEGALETDLVLPDAVRAGRPTTGVLVYRNTGTIDMPAPLLEIRSLQNIPMRLDRAYAFQRRPFRALAIGGGAGTAGTLSAGEQRVIPFHVIPEGAAHATFDFSVHVFDDETTGPIDWASLESEFRSPQIDGDAWARLWALFRADTGSTWIDWAAAMRRSADALSANGRLVHDPARLVASRFIHLAGYGIPTNLSISLDADAPAPGLPLSLLRSYPNTLLSRMRLGPFGRGWRNALWETTLEAMPTGEVVIRGGSNELRRFRSAADGSFLGASDDPGRFTRAGATFTLTETDLTTLTFLSNGLLASVADRFGNRVDLTYDGEGHLTRILHTSGDQLTFQWNGNGRIVRLTDPAGRVTTYDYDATGELLTTVTEPGGRVWHYGYRPATGGPADLALTSITLPDGTHRHFDYDATGRFSSRSADGGVEPFSFGFETQARMTTTNGSGSTSLVAFNETGRLIGTSDSSGSWGWVTLDDAANVTRVVGPDGAQASLTYGAFGELASLVDPLAGEAFLRRRYTTAGGVFVRGLVDPKTNASAFEFGSRNEVTALGLPDGSRWELVSDGTGEVTSVRNRRGQTIHYEHNARGQLVRKDLPGGVAILYDYDSAGRLTGVTGPEGTYTLQYDAREFVTRLSEPGGRFVAWEHDDAGKRTRRTTSDGSVVTWSWDAAGRLSEVRDGGGTLLSRYSYDAAGRLARQDRGNGAFTTWAYDASGRTREIAHRAPDGTVQDSLTYERDLSGNPVRLTSPAGETTWSWDALGRLVGAVEPSGRSVTYRYDAAGNRTEVFDGGATTSYSTNALNQATSAGGATFSYDADGNLVTRADATGTTTYEWDAEGHLVRVVHPTAGVFEYTYDALGRVATEVRGATTTRLLYDNTEIESERDGADALVARYASGYGLVARLPASGPAVFYGFDLAGSTRLLTDSAGAVVNRYELGPFGELRTAVEGVPNPFRFSGAFGVRSEEHGLIRMGARPYDPTLGRFVAPDPIGYLAGYNLYAYCGNSPIQNADPAGMEKISKDVSMTVKGLRKNMLSAAGEKGLSTLYGLWNAPGGIKKGLSEAAVGWKKGDVGMISHGLGTASWTGVSSIGGAAAAGFEYLLPGWGSLSVGGIALAPALAVGGLVVFADELYTDLYLESVKQQKYWLELGPAPRNPYAAYPEEIRPDGTLPEWRLELWRRFHGKPEIVEPGDPNEKLATPGAGPRHRVRSGDPLSYVVRFENVPTASAPAQEVFVDDVLDSSLDLSTLQVVSIGWGDRVLDVASADLPVSLRETVLDYRPTDGRRWFVDVSADLVGTRLRLTLRTVDPTTDDLPEDALAGFLPPNDATGRGQGFLELSVRTKTGLSPGTRIANTATITFDTQPPITTAEVFNTIGIPGDVNDDGVVNPADVFYLVSSFYSAGPAPLGIADVNDDGRVDALDLFYLINYLYAGGPAPV